MDSSHIAFRWLLSTLLVGIVTLSIWSGVSNGEELDAPIRLIMQRRQMMDQNASSLHSRKLELLQDAIKNSIARAHALGATTTLPRRSTMESRSGGSYILPVTAGTGAYVTQIQLGSPPRKQEVLVDTGSDLVWIQCEPCIQCFAQKDDIFDPDSSSSIKELQCSSGFCQALPEYACDDYESCIYGYQYGDGSQTIGSLVSDTLTLSSSNGCRHGSVSIRDLVFGCGHENDASFASEESGPTGLVGLGRGPLSLVQQLDSYIGGMFSYCLVDWNASSSIDSPLLLGSERIPYGTQFTPILGDGPTSTFYYVGLLGISIGGKRLPISSDVFKYTSSGGGTIFDSGTTLTLLPPSAQSEVVKAIKSFVSSRPIRNPPEGLDLCYSGKQNYPDMTFHFSGNANMKVPSENYMIVIDTKGTACLITASSDANFTIIGNLQQQNMHVFHDLRNSKIGFVPANCASL